MLQKYSFQGILKMLNWKYSENDKSGHYFEIAPRKQVHNDFSIKEPYPKN